MIEVLRKTFLREKSSSPVEEDEFSAEYSFAIEYKGPVINHEVPRVNPINVNYIPTAASVVSSSQFSDISSLPVMHPIVKKVKRDLNSCPKSAELACLDVRKNDNGEGECIVRSFDGIENSGELGTSGKLSGRLESGLESLEITNAKDLQGHTNSSDLESTRSSLSSSSEIFSGKEENEDNDIQPRHGRKSSTIIFLEPQTSSILSEETESIQFESESVEEGPRAIRNGKKGSCYRCLKGNRFTVKELCLVCGAKFCSECVIRAMGSMPEGRKCVTCIGYRIDELRRKDLGKCSKMLKRLLVEVEVERIMKCEKECEVNQLPPRLILVNDDPLNRDELILLRNCQKPPRKLKPGRYWYDKESGFWGKEGHGPCQIISPQLEVGGRLRKDASNGNTNVCINNREITKKELFMMKMAGVPCEGCPSFWVSADGSYQEEGMNNEGKIWDKTKMKLVCAILSFPIPSASVNSGKELVKATTTVCDERKMLHKLLLVGYNKSGTSTIFKQAKQIYKVSFSDDERQSIKFIIQRNLYRYLGILLEGRERFEEESLLAERNKESANDQSVSSGNEGRVSCKRLYSISAKLKGFADWLIEAVVSGNVETMILAAALEYAPFVDEMWKDEAIQATYSRRNELEMLPRVATYFLDRAVDISRTDYDPSDNDILYAEGISPCNSIISMDFSFPESSEDANLDPLYHHDSSLRYELIRVHPSSLGKKCKWAEMYEDTSIVLFCISLTDYSEFYEDDEGNLINKMIASKELFESIATALKEKNFLLILNKFDLFEEKINLQIPLNQCEWFSDFNPVITPNSSSSGCGRSNKNNNTCLAQRAFQYIAVKFKRIFTCIANKKLFVSRATGMEPENVNEVLRYAREIIKWQIDKTPQISDSEISCTNMEEASTFS